MVKVQSGLWNSGDAYEKYIGRWSRRVAPHFLDWLSVAPGSEWLDIGCGTGILSAAILARSSPKRVTGVDSSDAFIATTRVHMLDARFECRNGDALALPFRSNEFGAAVSGLVLNFIGDQEKAIKEMIRVVCPGGCVALYVWDYAGHMQLMRYLFDAATETDPHAREYDDGVQAPVCRPGPLSSLFRGAGLAQVRVQGLDIATPFEDFDDYWTPFIGGTGRAPKYLATLAPDVLQLLREKVRDRLPTGPDGEVLLAARAWAVQGTVPI